MTGIPAMAMDAALSAEKKSDRAETEESTQHWVSSAMREKTMALRLPVAPPYAEW